MIDVGDISVTYGERAVLEGVTFDLPDGKVLALLGANGAGKTTLVRALNGTVSLSAGEIVIDGKPLSHLSRREIARRVAVVAQENETRFPVTVLEFVLSGRFVHGAAFGWETDADVHAARCALEECDLAEFGSRYMNELSGGERQRVVLARALATNARILLLDEPTANLDLAHQAMMFRLVRERCDRDGASAVVITHDLNLAATFADEVLMLK
ncbi:MAG: ABC transporter ATP-binding protein, partial [Acidobacteria bacterium]|nr:ABC transporter ATP-binding protein [Acidobacteriota bacterium]